MYCDKDNVNTLTALLIASATAGSVLSSAVPLVTQTTTGSSVA